MKVYVITGMPCSGKTTTIKILKKRGFYVLEEAARIVLKEKFGNKSAKEVNPYFLQREIFKFQEKMLRNIPLNVEEVFSDRGFGDTLAYFKFHNLKIPKSFIEKTKKFRYEKIFFLEKLDFYKKDRLRKEEREEAEKIGNFIKKTYEEFGYKLINVPFMGAEERVDYILNKIK